MATRHGREAMRTVAPLWRALGTRNIALIAAGVAFFSLLSLFPAIAVLVSLVGIAFDPSVVETQLDLLSELLPEDALELIATQTDALVAANEGSIGLATVISLALALWSARLGVGALMTGLNAAHDVPNRSGLRHLMVAFLLTATLIAIALTALAAVIILPLVLSLLPLGGLEALAVSAGTWAVALAVLILGLSIIYRYGPNHYPRQKWMTPGLALAVGIWVPASAAFSWYLSNFGNYNEIYGSLGAVIALLMWLYIAAYAVLLGALLNAASRQGHSDTAPESGH